MHALVLLCINQHTEFEMPSLKLASPIPNMIGGKFLKMVHMTQITFIEG